jgi:hypothetical protein
MADDIKPELASALIPISQEAAADFADIRDSVRRLLNGEPLPPPPPPPPTPAGHMALLDTLRMDGVLRAVIELHTPHWSAWWHCEGCDLGIHAQDWPDWPCSTVQLIAEQLGVDLRSADG